MHLELGEDFRPVRLDGFDADAQVRDLFGRLQLAMRRAVSLSRSVRVASLPLARAMSSHTAVMPRERNGRDTGSTRARGICFGVGCKPSV